MSTDDNIERIDIEEFRRTGYLQELNRRFLHPLGLALEVHIDDDGTETLGGIWDYRGEGMRFDDLTSDRERENAALIDELLEAGKRAREAELGYFIQPVEGARNLDDDRRLADLFRRFLVDPDRTPNDTPFVNLFGSTAGGDLTLDGSIGLDRHEVEALERAGVEVQQ